MGIFLMKSFLLFVIIAIVLNTSKCNPECAWKCDDPKCPATCEPVCEAPNCHTSCAKPKCELVCENPTCAPKVECCHCHGGFGMYMRYFFKETENSPQCCSCTNENIRMQ